MLKKPFHGLFQLAKRKVSFSLCFIFQAHKTCLKNGGGTLRYALPCTAPQGVDKQGLSTPCYLHAYASVSEAKAGLRRYFDFYNARRPHQSLDGMTPDAIYFNNLPQEQLAA